jgi:hypothetical protein
VHSQKWCPQVIKVIKHLFSIAAIIIHKNTWEFKCCCNKKCMRFRWQHQHYVYGRFSKSLPINIVHLSIIFTVSEACKQVFIIIVTLEWICGQRWWFFDFARLPY